MLLLKFLVRRKDLYQAPEKDSKPPLWIRGVLMLTCTLVSFFHGSNDGQKGMGLMMLILVGLLPAAFALNMANEPARIQAVAEEMIQLGGTLAPFAQGATVGPDEATAELTRFAKQGGEPTTKTYAAVALESTAIGAKLYLIPSMESLPAQIG